MTDQSFGGPWTVEKLHRVRQYLAAYVTVMQNQHHLTKYYIDAFAGTGYVKLKSVGQDDILDDLTEAEVESQVFLQGSAVQALEIEPEFDRFVFIEESDWRVAELRTLQRNHANRWGCVEIVHGDANEHLRQICSQWNQRSDRGVVFLDPFGMSVEWPTLQAIARTKSLDVWYLVPISAVIRMMPREREVPAVWRDRLRLFFGTDDWQTVLYERRVERNLFDDTEVVERADWHEIQDFLVARLRTIFPGVASNPLPLKTDNGSPLFLLCFAVSNPNPTARGIALRIAEHILGRA